MNRLIAVGLLLLVFGACAGDEDDPAVTEDATTTTADIAESLPRASTTTAAPATTAPAPQPLVATTVDRPAPTSPPPTTAEVRYANCDEARAAGAAPIRQGEPGYRSGLDRDNDGIACDK